MAKLSISDLEPLLAVNSPLTPVAREELAYWLRLAAHAPVNDSAQVLNAVLLRGQSPAVTALAEGTGIAVPDLLRYASTIPVNTDQAAAQLAGLTVSDVEALRRQAPGSVALGPLLQACLFVQAFSKILVDTRPNPAASAIANLARQVDIDINQLARAFANAEAKPVRHDSPPLLAVAFSETGQLVVTPVRKAGDHPFCENERSEIRRVSLLLPAYEIFQGVEIDEFTAMLASTKSSEADYQRFFARYPSFLYLLGHHDYDAFRREVALSTSEAKDEGGTVGILSDVAFTREDWLPQPEARVDFMLRRSQLNRWDPLELKLPQVKLVVGSGRRATFSQSVHKAISQLRDYAKRLSDRSVRTRVREQYGMNISTPYPMLLIGRDYNDPSLIDSIETISAETARDIGLYTYDRIVRMAQRRRIAQALIP